MNQQKRRVLIASASALSLMLILHPLSAHASEVNEGSHSQTTTIESSTTQDLLSPAEAKPSALPQKEGESAEGIIGDENN